MTRLLKDDTTLDQSSRENVEKRGKWEAYLNGEANSVQDSSLSRENGLQDRTRVRMWQVIERCVFEKVVGCFQAYDN